MKMKPTKSEGNVTPPTEPSRSHSPEPVSGSSSPKSTTSSSSSQYHGCIGEVTDVFGPCVIARDDYTTRKAQENVDSFSAPTLYGNLLEEVRSPEEDRLDVEMIDVGTDMSEESDDQSSDGEEASEPGHVENPPNDEAPIIETSEQDSAELNKTASDISIGRHQEAYSQTVEAPISVAEPESLVHL